MKRILFVIISILFYSFLFSEWIEIDANQEKLFECRASNLEQTELHFTLDGFESETIDQDGQIYQKLSYWNEGEFAEVGKPDLPRFSRLVAIPEQGTVSFEIINLQEEILTNMNIYPRQEFQKDNQPIETRFVKDEEFYARDEVFPGEIVEIGTPAILRDFRIVNVTIDPFQYNPQTRELRIIKDIEVIVNVDGAAGENIKYNSYRKKSRAFEALYRSSIINYDEVVSENMRDDEYQTPCYLFIYTNNLNLQTSGFDALLNWKHQKGFEVNTQGFNSGTSSSTIKSYIQDAYDNWDNPPEFVCLVGDAGGSYDIPTGYMSGGPGDQYYTLLEGNDILADVFIGRLSFNSLFELQTIVYKILYYEKEPYLGQTAWYRKALLVGDPTSSGWSCVFTKQSIKEMIAQHAGYFSFIEVYNTTAGSWASQIANALNAGVSYFNYRGYWGMSGFSNSNISNLSNGSMLPVVVTLTCATGSFQGTSDCISERFLKVGSPGMPKGAIACIGTATLSTHTCFNNCVDGGIFYGIFADKIYHMGGALNRGKLNLYLNYPSNPNNWVEKFSYWNNLMGDPGMEVWTNIPESMNVLYEPEVAYGTNYLEVTVTDGFGSSLEGAWVCALKGNDEIFKLSYTDEDGKVFLPLNSAFTGEVNLTVTNHDFIPHLGSFDIVQTDQFVNTETIIIDDDNSGESSGNDDQLINPGEVIELIVELKNYGTQATNSVSAVISTETEFITITDDYEEYGNILPGGTSVCYDDFGFSVPSDVLGGSEIVFNLDIEDDDNNQWNDNIFLMVDGANLYASSYTIIDGNNQILDPGETADVVVTLKNIGTVSISGLNAILRCSHQSVTIPDSTGFYFIINPNTQVSNTTNPFEVSISSDVIPGSQIPFTILLTNDDGYNDEINLIIEVGQVFVTDPLGPDAYGYYCYDSFDSAYDLAPVYNWIEIDPNNGGNGQVLPLSDPGDNGDIELIYLPFDFRFYGQVYNSITVCSNGWIAFGAVSQASFMNWTIPGPLGPSPMIAPFWDDLRTSNGAVCYYYDQNTHRFIVEWSELKNDYNNATETFQVILYDPVYYVTPTQDGEILFQYETVNNVDQGNYYSGYVAHGEYATVGLENHDGDVGLEYTYSNQYPTAAKPLQDNLALFFTTKGAEILAPPVMQLSQNYFQFTVLQNNSDFQVLGITNTGQANLVYNIAKNYEDESSRASGGPDEYGYVWVDSNELNGPSYSWRDISGLGTEVTFVHNDEGTPLMPIGFDFNYYGTEYSEFRINPNGWIGFGDDNTEWSNNSIPHPDAPRPAIMTFWDDLDPIDGGNVYYYSTSDSLVVWFDDVIHYVGNYNGTYDFEMIIYADGKILFQYRTVSGDINTNTIGIQNELGDIGLEIVYNSTYVQNELAILFRKEINWLDVDPASGFVESGETDYVIISVSTEELDVGDYTCNLIVTSNDPNSSLITIPVDLTVVSQLPDIVVSADSLNFGIVYIGSDSTKVLTVSNQGSDPLIVSNISSDADEFIVDITGFTLQPGQSQNVNVTFTPIFDELIFGILSITSNDPNNPIVEVSLYGQGLIPGVPNIDVSADSLDFGIVIVGTDSLKTLTVSNNGDISLSVTEIYTNTDEYSVDLTSFDLEPDEFQNLTITFAPSYEGTILDTLTILSNDPDEPVVEVALQGQGFIPIPIIQVSADSLDFGVVIIGSDSLNTLNVTNIGTLTLSVTNIYTNTDEYSVNLIEFNLEPEENQVLEITFAPGYEGVILDTLFIESNDPVKPVYPVSLQGEGAPLVNSGDDNIPLITTLGKNYPNPFNPETTINFALHEPAFTRIEIFNIKGQKIKTLINEHLEARHYQIIWNGTDDSESSVASGIYLYRMSADKFTETRKMLLVK